MWPSHSSTDSEACPDAAGGQCLDLGGMPALGKVAELCVFTILRGPPGLGIRPQENTPPNQGFHVSGDEHKHGKPLVFNLQ